MLVRNSLEVLTKLPKSLLDDTANEFILVLEVVIDRRGTHPDPFRN